MSHTPGPWEAEQRGFGYPDYEGGPVRRLWDVCGPNGELVMIGTIVAENEANARLTAAAPDLLAALVRLMRSCVGRPCTYCGGEHALFIQPTAADLAQARAAIARATEAEKEN